ncbi:MAG: GGDEF domain-containing protein [Lachnospiraceae bacterium]|nr:GGDEF domain-containing protein [Candidatus Colinaster equi]
MDVYSQWCLPGENAGFDKTTGIDKFTFLEGKKPIVLSSGISALVPIKEKWPGLSIKAIVSMPVSINQTTNLYATYIESNVERNWKIEELQFLNDASKVLQNILEKRIQKNSLASSYASLEQILERVGCAIIVNDVKNDKILFQNKIMRSMFPSELISEELSDIIWERKKSDKDIIEYYEYSKGSWYEIHHSNISWVDSRPVAMYAIYDVTDKKNYQRKIEQQAYTDFLTGLLNRMCCERDLARIIDEAKRENQKGALMYLDLDNFKHINDGLGHQYGDILLKSIAGAMKSVHGIEENCYRMGGDEFVIIIPPHSYRFFNEIVDNVKSIFAKPWFLKDADYYCTMSMGIVTFPDEGEGVDDLIKKADIAMYEAKKSGKNRVATYNSKSLTESSKRLDMEKNMRDATNNGFEEFLVYYQPVIDISLDGTPCTGAEALIRWDSRELGFISPADFIPLAEYLGLINPIGDYVLKEACKECKRWNDNGHPNYKVNVNLSVVQLMQNDIVERVKETVEETGINPRNLTLEVTESLAINDMDRMKVILSQIRELGVRIALDDFGTGYSSLNHIREIPLDVIKVDQSFVKELAEDDYSKSFIKMVGELAGVIGVSICVEGIETLEQYKVLEGMNVRLIQGYYFDKPMSRDDFEKKYVFNGGDTK